MNIIEQKNFRLCYSTLAALLMGAPRVQTEKWQGVDASRPEMATHEIEDLVLEFPIATEDLNYHRFQIGPNLPWADAHFEQDRIGGHPVNPGFTWQDWPYSLKADTFREIKRNGWEDRFNHTYAERYFPKHANISDRGIVAPELAAECPMRRGIRYNYGDLSDVVALLASQPNTRQAYLPVFFPEDTGAVHGSRTPCTLGYLFRMRNGQLNITYYIRSCDFVRHFKDDVYLTVRLLLWVLDECRQRNQSWSKVKPGRFLMHVGSMHVFVNDHRRIFQTPEPHRD